MDIWGIHGHSGTVSGNAGAFADRGCIPEEADTFVGRNPYSFFGKKYFQQKVPVEFQQQKLCQCQ